MRTPLSLPVAMALRICVAALCLCVSVLPAMALTVETILENGDSADHLDIVVVGDGYTASEQAVLTQDAQSFVAQFFLEEPYASYKGRFNVWLVHVESPQSGVDKTDAISDASCSSASVLVDTALDCTYCCYGMQRLICCDSSQAWTLMDQGKPEWDVGVILVNSTVYGGSGGSLSIFSRNAAIGYLSQHEMAHTLAGLADEYEACYPSYSQAYESPNITHSASRESVSWNDLIDPATPVPTFRHVNCNGVMSGTCGADLSGQASNCIDDAGTPASNDYWMAYVNLVGLFEGGRYLHTANYRPAFDCKMRSMTTFCPVCTRTIISWIKYYAPDPPVEVCDGVDNDGDGTADEEAPCDDGNTCTDDACDAAAGSCVFVADDTHACSDGNACTLMDSCAAGICLGSSLKPCDDGGPCTDDSCNPDSGDCSFAPDDTNGCSDGNACTLVDGCTAGVCVGSVPLACDDANVCTDDSCDPAAGCVHAPNSAACDDGTPCTSNVCAFGDCLVLASTPGCCQQQSECDGVSQKCDEEARQCIALGCLKCLTDSDCGSGGALCTTFPSGNYCTLPCIGNSDACADEDYVCDVALDPPRCVPAQGDCVCVSDAYVVCLDQALRFTDSCGHAGSVVDECGNRGCAGSACCPLQTHQEGSECVPDVVVETPDTVEDSVASDLQDGLVDGQPHDGDLTQGDLFDACDAAETHTDASTDLADLQPEAVTDSMQEVPGADLRPDGVSPETQGDGQVPAADLLTDTGTPQDGPRNGRSGGCQATPGSGSTQMAWTLLCLLGLLVGACTWVRRRAV